MSCNWVYRAPRKKVEQQNMCITPELCTTLSKCDKIIKEECQRQTMIFPDADGPHPQQNMDDVSKRTKLDLGNYCRSMVSNLMEQPTTTDQRSEPGSIMLPERMEPFSMMNGGMDGSMYNKNESQGSNGQYVDGASWTTGLNHSRNARTLFNEGLLHIFGFHHEEAAKCFLLCLKMAPHCVLAHGMVALCHSPNYNFRGQAYYDSTNYTTESLSQLCLEDPQVDDDNTCNSNNNDMTGSSPRSTSSSSVDNIDEYGLFPSQQVADYHTRMAMEKIEQLNGTSKEISHVEQMLIRALRKRTCQPGVDPVLADTLVGRPYADEMRRVYETYPDDPEVAFMFADSLMVLNAWNLYEFPTGRPLTPDVREVEHVLQSSLEQHPNHAGLCHLYVHLSEMHSDPGRALAACRPLRTMFPDSGHLIHMATHIDVLVGDYEGVVRWNMAAIEADRRAMSVAPETAGRMAFYFGYIVHNFHMLVYGGILGGMEGVALKFATQLNSYLDEDLFVTYPDLAVYLESYSALEIHVHVRFGRWKEILEMTFPEHPELMLFRTASLLFARGIALASLGRMDEAIVEADRFDLIRQRAEASQRILHNNYVSNLLDVDAPMLRGEIAYRSGHYDKAFELLEQAVRLQDGLNYDEPWGKMQPIRHALGGLLLEQNHLQRAEEVFRQDLKIHPLNPYGLRGLIDCLKKKRTCSLTTNNIHSLDDLRALEDEIKQLEQLFHQQRQNEWADANISFSCACCGRMSSSSEEEDETMTRDFG